MGEEKVPIISENKKGAVFKNKMLTFNYQENSTYRNIFKKLCKKRKEVTDDRVPKTTS